MPSAFTNVAAPPGRTSPKSPAMNLPVANQPAKGSVGDPSRLEDGPLVNEDELSNNEGPQQSINPLANEGRGLYMDDNDEDINSGEPPGGQDNRRSRRIDEKKQQQEESKKRKSSDDRPTNIPAKKQKSGGKSRGEKGAKPPRAPKGSNSNPKAKKTR